MTDPGPHSPSPTPADATPTPAGAAAFDAVLGAMQRPHDPVATLSGLLGMSPGAARRAVGALVSTSDQAEALLDAMPRALRRLAVATAEVAVRCVGEVRGPILWSETMAARSASVGDPGLVVCSTPARAFDTAENRVLAAALDTVHRAGHDATGHGHPTRHDTSGPSDAAPGPNHRGDPDHAGGLLVRRARHNAVRAQRFLDHQALADVPRAWTGGRAMNRTRSGRRRATYGPALDLLARAAAPYRGEHLDLLATDRDRAGVELLASVLAAARAAGVALSPLRPYHGELVAGPVRYRHPAAPADPARPPGLWLATTEVRTHADLAPALASLAPTPARQ